MGGSAGGAARRRPVGGQAVLGWSRAASRGRGRGRGVGVAQGRTVGGPARVAPVTDTSDRAGRFGIDAAGRRADEMLASRPADGELVARPGAKSPKLLLAHGGEAAAEWVAELLAADFQVVQARRGSEAVSIAQHEHPDLFVLDAEILPEGFETCRALRASAAGRETPIIMISASARPEDAVRAFDAGASDYIVRPLSPAQLRAKAHTWLLRTSRRHA